MAATGMTTYLWFDDQALEAATFYVGLFPDSRLGNISYYQADAQRPEGSVGHSFHTARPSVSRSHAKPRTTSIAYGTH